MSLSENIKNAFEVVEDTYKNIDKLMKYCDTIADNNNYLCMNDKFLRYKSDKEYSGWFTREFIKLYQNKCDNTLENEWLEGPIYGFEINFHSTPKLNIFVFKYDGISNWSKGVSPASSWIFSNPMRTDITDRFIIEKIKSKENYFLSKPINKTVKEKYWGINNVVFTEYNLITITKDNVLNSIFKQFNYLKSLNIKTDNI